MNSPCGESRRNISRFSSATRAAAISEFTSSTASCEEKKSHQPKSCNAYTEISPSRFRHGRNRGASSVAGRNEKTDCSLLSEWQARMGRDVLWEKHGDALFPRAVTGSHRRLLKEIWIAAIQQRQVSRNRG